MTDRLTSRPLKLLFAFTMAAMPGVIRPDVCTYNRCKKRASDGEASIRARKKSSDEKICGLVYRVS